MASAEEFVGMPGEEQSAQPATVGADAEMTSADAATSAGEPPTAPSEGDQHAELEARVAELERQLAQEREAATDYMQRWQRAQADFSNFRRRSQQEMEQRDRQVAAEALAPVLLALDSFERAFQTLPESL